ncbi:glycosyltransferase family 2 protein [uncultured Lutibacter sp.]|uniref:glycosyltransferase family 2 protein n=1 Tax=uncultured Lutibacter sp. TaxID=437739 RepID=UPI0026252F83|nr:glycosyltransferase family 2 protein [uncultured Lutibacter sp.]
MTAPIISIIIPTYNSDKTLAIALDSVVQQTFKQWELVIMDGGSTDTTLPIIASYQQKFPTKILFQSKKDKGIYDAMNKGIQLAKGEWLYFMGSDDSLYESTTLEKVLTLKELNTHDVVYGNVKIIGETGWAKDGDIYDGKFTLEKILNKNISHQAIFYRSNFIKEKIGSFNLNYVKSADWDFNLKCWSKTNFFYTHKIIANFKAGGYSSNSIDYKLIDDFVFNILNYFKISLFHPILNNTNFVFYSKVKKMQEIRYPLRFRINNLIKKIIKKLK